MLTFYLTGWAAALVLILYGEVKNRLLVPPLRVYNLAKIGFYVEPSTLRLVTVKPSVWAYLRHLAWLLLIEPLLSWVNVGLAVLNFVRQRHVAQPDSTTLNKLRELNFKLNSMDLPRREVKAAFHALSEILGTGKNHSTWEALVEGNGTYDLDVSDEHSLRNLVINPVKKEFEFKYRSKEWYGVSEQTVEYKIDKSDAIKVFTRELRYESRGEEGKHLLIADRVVHEDAVRQTHPGLFESAEERIAELKSRTEWSEVQDLKIKVFILDNHPEILPDDEFYRFVRVQLEKVRDTCRRVDEYIKSKDDLLKMERKNGMWTISLSDPLAIKFKEALDQAHKDLDVQASHPESFLKRFENARERVRSEATGDLLKAFTLEDDVEKFWSSIEKEQRAHFMYHEDLIKGLEKFL